MTNYRSIPEFVEYEPSSGDVIKSAHIRNIEYYISQLIEVVDPDGNSSTGVTTLKFGSGFVVDGNALSGVVIHATGSTQSSSVTSIPAQAIPSNFYCGMIVEQLMMGEGAIEGAYIKADNAPSGNILIDMYKNSTKIAEDMTLGTGGVIDFPLTGVVSVAKGDKIYFEVTSVSDVTAGYSVYFGIY